MENKDNFMVSNNKLYIKPTPKPTAIIEIGQLCINIYDKTFTEEQIKNMREYFGWDVSNIEENK